MNMFKQVKARTVEEYLSELPKERKETVSFLHSFIQRAVPQLKPYFANNMLGYGSFQYKNYKKEVIDWPIVAVANQKNYVSVYVCSVIDGQYVAEKYQKGLGRVSVGKSCIRFKKIEDVNLPILKKVIIEASKKPGLVSEKK